MPILWKSNHIYNQPHPVKGLNWGFFEANFKHPPIGSARRRFRPEAVVSAPAALRRLVSILCLPPYICTHIKHMKQADILNMLEGFSVPWCYFASNPFPY